jgi:hypothetical protein
MSTNAFLKPAEFYQREVNPIRNYIEQTSFYLHKMSGNDLNVCKEIITKNLRTKSSVFKDLVDPEVRYFERNDVGDRNEANIRLSNYISDVNKNEEILVPTFTTYLNTSIKKSIIVDFIDGNVKRRSKAKEEAFIAKGEGKKDLYIAKENEQANMKLYNNSLSGAFAAGGNVLNNPTAHNTLTSITRTESSLGNASNEKIIAGNRHYRNADTVLNNLISITSDLDREALTHVVIKYCLHIPTKQNVIDCIKYSSDLYWRDERAFQKIYDYIDKLDDIERVGFVYISDMFHIRKYNPNLIKVFLTTLATKINNHLELKPKEQLIDLLHKFDEQVINFGHLICLSEVKGIGKDYTKLSDIDINTLYYTCCNIQNTVDKYKDFIDAIFLTKHIPSNTAYIPNMIRRTVVLSDTDSTMFSVDEYVKWYFGKIIFNDEAFAIASAVMFIATQCIAHTLAVFSANLNVERPKLFNMAMKPEYAFPVFAQTPVAKHYFTCKTVQEGNVFKEMEMEIKGVHLKNSAAPRSIIKPAHAKMKQILLKIMNNEKIALLPELKEVAELERKISTSLLNGEVEYYKQSKIKTPEAYARSALESPYMHHLFWQSVFEPKYGKTEEAPYSVIKIPTIVDNITAVKRWIEIIKDKELADRLNNWFVARDKRDFPTIYISTAYIKAFGIPEEIKPIINIERIILDLTVVNRMILETLGYCPKTEKLIKDHGY